MDLEEVKKPLIKVRGKRQDLQKKEKNAKPRYSNFHLTINTNQQFKKDDPNLENDIEIFDTAISDICNNIGEYVRLPAGVPFNETTIQDVNIDYATEVGGVKGTLHVHILFCFKHFTKILLDYEKIKKKLLDELGLDNIYMYNRLIKGSGSENLNVLNYINKLT
jgi:hypothetical protein